MGYDPSEPRDSHGRWGSGGAAVTAAVAKAGAFTKSSAQAALAFVNSEGGQKTLVSLGIKSALYHLGSLDDPAMEIVDPYVHNMVHNVAEHLQVARGRAYEMMIAHVDKLIAARKSLGV